jgi:hypothetical protein
MKTSTIDRHPERDRIADELRRGVPASVVARAFGLSKDAIGRFRRRLLAPKAGDPPEGVHEKQLNALWNAATAAVRKAAESGRARDQIAAQREARATLTQIIKLRDKEQKAKAALGSGSDLNSPPAEAIHGALIRALADFPEARAAVVEALNKLEAEWRPKDKVDAA